MSFITSIEKSDKANLSSLAIMGGSPAVGPSLVAFITGEELFQIKADSADLWLQYDSID